MEFKDSPNSKSIFDYYEGKYGLGLVGLVKCTVVASTKVKNKEVLPLSILDISPSGNFKSRSSFELQQLFPAKYTVFLGSDFTIHSIIRQYRNGKLLDGKIGVINDLALLLSSKQIRTRNRLMAALAELLSDGIYLYGERDTSMKLEACMGLIANVTLESYLNHPDVFQRNTLIERFLAIYHPVDYDSQREFILDREKRFQMKPRGRLSLRTKLVEVSKGDKKRAAELASKWRLYVMSPSLCRVNDKIMSLLCGHCVLNGRNTLTEDDWMLLEAIQPMLLEPTVGEKEHQVLKLYNEDKQVKEITQQVDYKSEKSVYNILHKYRRRGVIK